MHAPLPETGTVKALDGVKDVQSYGYVSPLCIRNSRAEMEKWMVRHMYWSEKEDCQNLNIWTPSIRDGRNVRLWYTHGGGFSAGSSIEQPAHDGENLLSEMLLVASVNQAGRMCWDI